MEIMKSFYEVSISAVVWKATLLNFFLEKGLSRHSTGVLYSYNKKNLKIKKIFQKTL